MPPPIPSIPKPFLEEHVAAAAPDVDVKMQEWEEPHPGRRLSYPHDRMTKDNWDAFTTGEAGRRGGMAAEGRWPGNRKFSLVVPAAAKVASERRPSTRGRSRNPPSQLVFSDSEGGTINNHEPQIQTAPLLRPVDLHRGNSNVSIDMMLAPEMAPSETGDMYSADVSGTDSDTEGLSIAEHPRRKLSLAPLDTTPQGLQMSDFSGHLGIRMEVDDGPKAFSMEGSDGNAFCIMSPNEDLYGWDAILTHQSTRTTNEPFLPLAPCQQQRRASRSKRSLLQRVFSPGGATSGDEMPDTTPTSFAWSKHDEQQL